MDQPKYVQAMQDLRRSNATRPRPARTPRKQGTRKGKNDAAIKEQK
jgi:hypothetical protein